VKNIKSTIVNQTKAEVTFLEIKRLGYVDDYKAYIIEIDVGLQTYKCELQLNNELQDDTFYFKKLGLYGLLQNTTEGDLRNIKICGDDYYIFLTSDNLHNRIRPHAKKVISKTDLPIPNEYWPSIEYNFWQIEFVRKHDEYEVYFLKLATIDENLSRHRNHKYLTDYRKFY